MKNRLFFLTVFLVAVLLIASCSPASPTQETIVLPPTTSAIDPVVVIASPLGTETTVPNVEATQIPAVDATQIPAVIPIATSRGDELHATDPSTVSLASGQLQLVEFFRFT
jgi:hypothetical protein